MRSIGLPPAILKTVEGFVTITQYTQRVYYGPTATVAEIAEMKKQAAEALKAIAGQ